MDMKNLNWLELTKRIYFVLWGLFVIAICLWMFNLVILESNYQILAAEIPMIAGSIVGPWILLKLSRWVFAGLNEKKSS